MLEVIVYFAYGSRSVVVHIVLISYEEDTIIFILKIKLFL